MILLDMKRTRHTLVKCNRLVLTLFMLCAVNLLWSGSVFAQEDEVDVTVGDIPPLQQVTITYDATVNETLPEGLLFIENQGVVTGTNFDVVNSDDPRTLSVGDETLTSIGFTLNVVQLPQTGETPLYRLVLISAIVALVVTGVVGGLHFRRFYQPNGIIADDHATPSE
ncbi:MAG: hypothetical protein AAFQ07_11860 [Chloroflexota bacterium]